MAFCSKCGAELQEDAKFCPACGSQVSNISDRTVTAPPQMDHPAKLQRKQKRSIFRRWWFWVLIIAVIGMLGRSGARGRMDATHNRSESMVSVTAAPTAVPMAEPSPTPTSEPTQEPKQTTVSENEIRPEVKEFLDSYEACMDEYVAFMQKYMNADPTGMVSMMGDYYTILTRYTEFSEKIDAIDESELTSAELAYYIEISNRVSQKLLTVAG